MKHSTVRRWLAFLLSAVLLASLLPALSLTAGARDPQKVNASSADELKTYLESNTDYDITLTKNIDKTIGSTEVWCTVRGTKRLDMNGFDVLVHQDGGKIVSYLFRVSSDANLTVYDGKNMETTAKIHYHAEILSGNMVGTIAYWRHLFDVYGKLTINNVMCTAGRVTTRWNYTKLQNVSVQTYGSAAIVHGGGYLEVNGAYLTGHTYIPELHATPVIKTENDAQVYFNFGEVHGHGSADCFSISRDATVQVASGIFDSDYYSKVMWGLEKETNQVDFPGWVGLDKEHLAPNAVSNKADTYTSSSVSVSSPTLRCTIEAPNGTEAVSDVGVRLRLLRSSPRVRVIKPTPYFHTDVDNSPKAEHIFKVVWELYDGVRFMADTVKDNVFDLNVMTDFQDFTPELGKYYKLRCTIIEAVKYGPNGASCYYRSFRTTGTTYDTWFLLVEDPAAPTIDRDLPSSAVFKPGQQLQLSIQASGMSLRYQWYALDPSRPTRPEAISGQTTRTLSISNARETLDGAYIYCVVSNAAGSVQTSYCKLGKEQTVIKEIPILNLDQPMHGMQLDPSVDIDIPGVRLVRAFWNQIHMNSYSELGTSDAAHPIAGQTAYLCAVVEYDNTVVMDDNVKATALGNESESVLRQSGNQLWFFIPFTVAAEETMGIPSVTLDFGGEAVEEGKQAGTIGEKYCGYPSLDSFGDFDPDIRYTIHSQNWYVDDVETENPTVEKDHTYTLKVRLRAGRYWKFTENTAIIADGAEVPFTIETVKVAKEEITYALFDLKYATKEMPPEDDIQNPFVDVQEGAYYYEPVLWAVNHHPQITNGTDATHFSPDKTCTRAQVVTFLWRAKGEPEPTLDQNPFTDVNSDAYYYKAVLWAVEKGVTTGTSTTTFSPDSGCTRGQVVTFLWRAEGQPEPTSTNNPFTDVQEGQYYYKAVLWAVEKEITKGTSADKFSPNSTCTRGQIVTFLYRDMA